MEKGRAIRDAISKGETVTLEPVVVKGMFNDILAQEPTLWELYDILWDVKSQLSYQVWNLQALGQTDFTEVLALWGEALDEFKAAAITSFMFWNDIADAELEIETDDETLSNALELEKSLKAVAGAIESATDDDARKHLRAAGERIIELAKSIDILPEDSAAGAPQIPEADQTEEMRKQLADAQTREADLRTQLDEANGDLEIAKAGLKANRFWILDLGFWINPVLNLDELWRKTGSSKITKRFVRAPRSLRAGTLALPSDRDASVTGVAVACNTGRLVEAFRTAPISNFRYFRFQIWQILKFQI